MALVAQEGCRTLERVVRSEPNPRPDIERQESASRSQHHSQAQQPSAGRCCVSLQAVISSLAAVQANAGQDVPAAIRAAGSAIVHRRRAKGAAIAAAISVYSSAGPRPGPARRLIRGARARLC